MKPITEEKAAAFEALRLDPSATLDLLARCDCGHWARRTTIKITDKGTACPKCYERSLTDV